MPAAVSAANAPPGPLLTLKARSRPFPAIGFQRTGFVWSIGSKTKPPSDSGSVEASHTPWLG
jgi:hypothetical protein